MNANTSKFKVRLGLFIAGGLVLFVVVIFIIGKQKNMFNPVILITTTFNDVSGLQVGSNIRFSGINVGTVNDIRIINNSTVKVEMLIKKNVQQFIKADCEASIGSSGIIGDRILIISHGPDNSPMAKNGQAIASKEPIDLDAIIESLKVTVDNAAVISNQLSEIMIKINSGQGTLGSLIMDAKMAENVNQTIVNLKSSSEGLDENMKAAKESFLLRGYFKRKEKEKEEKTKNKQK